ncbi:MAG: PIG-L family deacetylase [Acidobacteriota bacterium]|nr:PIG-L family deacetylase [Acidobacteriota bacterium]
MKFQNSEAQIFIPDGKSEAEAFRRITHLGIGAHQDDVEIMAWHGVLNCFHSDDRWFGAVTSTNGSGSPRAGKYASYSDAEMAALRRREQEKAAVVGNYGFLIQLNHSSGVVKNVQDPAFKNDLITVLSACRPSVVYTHNLADKHDTHLAVGMTVVQAIRALPAEQRPGALYGCEVWRNLDWLLDEDKVPLDVTGHENVSAALIGVYDSQVAGGKRYDLATPGRRRANATYFQSHDTDEAEMLCFAMDLTPLIKDVALDVAGFVLRHIDNFRRDVENKIRKYSAPQAA